MSATGRPPEPDPAAGGAAGETDRTRTSFDDTRRLAAGSLVAGRYRVAEFLGLGAMGMVYRARDEELGVEVALKVLRPDLAADSGLLERFRRELVLARQVTHRNVVRIHDIGQDGDLRFLTMDHVAGHSLRQILERRGRLPAAEAAAIARQLAAALEAAHLEGIVHRDLKPANVLIDETGRAFITDFGVARSLTTAGLTRAGGVVGTPDYLSPEQARGDEVDGRSDLYALGILLFEMLTGQLPFPGASSAETLAQRLHGDPRDLADAGVTVPARLRRVVRRCLERNPRRRYQRASEVVADLADLADLERPEGPAFGFTWRRAAAAALVLLAVAAALWAVWRRGAGDEASAAGAPLPPLHAVAVVPFEDETGRPELAWMATGLAELLAENLAESPRLRVVDSGRLLAAVEELRLGVGGWGDAPLRQLAELFEVDRLIVGRVRSLGGRLRLEGSVVTAGPGELERSRLIAETVPAGEIAAAVGRLAAAARGRLEVAAATAAAGPAGSASPVAIESYAEGSRLLARGEALAAAPALEKAVAADPRFAAAWVKLAEAYARLGYLDRAEEAMQEALPHLEHGSRLALEAPARHALLRGAPEEAQGAFAELVGRYPNDVESALDLAEAQGEQGMFAAAIAGLGRLAEIDPSHPRVWYLLAKYSILAGDSRRAVEDYLVRALVLQNRLQNEQGKADVLNAFGVAYRELGDLDQALTQYRQAAELREQMGDRRGYATTLRNLAGVQLIRGDFAEAEKNLSAALEILEEIGDRAGVADLHNDFGVLAEERGEYAAALEHYRRALQLRQELGDGRAIAESLNNVGYAYYTLGEYDNARVYWEQALDRYRASENREGVVLTTQNIGLLQLAQGEWNAAVRAFLDALEESRQAEMRDATAVSLGALGRLAHLQGRYPAALASFDEALAILSELGDPRGLTEFTLARADTLLDLGMLAEAEALLEEAGKWISEAQNREQIAERHRLRGALHLERGQISAAEGEFRRALAEAEASHGILIVARARLGLARAALAAGRPHQAVGELEALRGEARRLGHAQLELEAAEGLARALLAAGRPDAAAAAAEAGLGRAEGSWARAHRLHALLAAALAAQGESEAAREALDRAAAELERVRSGLTAEQRTAFDRRQEAPRLVAEAR